MLPRERAMPPSAPGDESQHHDRRHDHCRRRRRRSRVSPWLLPS